MTTNSNSVSPFTPPRLRRIFCSLFLGAAVIAAVGAIAAPHAARQGGGPVSRMTTDKIAPWVMEHTANGQRAEFFVVLADQADLSRAATLETKAENGRYVYNTMLNERLTTERLIQPQLPEHG